MFVRVEIQYFPPKQTNIEFLVSIFLPIWLPIVPYLFQLPMLTGDTLPTTPSPSSLGRSREQYAFSKPRSSQPRDRNSEVSAIGFILCSDPTAAESPPSHPRSGEPIMPLPHEPPKLSFWQDRDANELQRTMMSASRSFALAVRHCSSTFLTIFFPVWNVPYYKEFADKTWE